MMSIKTVAKWLLPEAIILRIKRIFLEKRIARLKSLESLSLDELRHILKRDLGITSGDTIFVHSSYSDLKMDCTPNDIINCLTELVGAQGNILMPFYPLKTSYLWLQSKKPFDLRKNRTSMGALASAFALNPNVRKSLHPTKSIAVYGKDRDFLISEHQTAPMPYGKTSPYYKVSLLPNSKIIGIGVTSAYLSCMHVAVDIEPSYPIQPYHPEILEGLVVDHDGKEHTIQTYAHDMNITSRENVPKFLTETKCPTYKEFVRKGRPFFVVGAMPLIQHTANQGKKGSTFFYPRSLNNKQPKRMVISK